MVWLVGVLQKSLNLFLLFECVPNTKVYGSQPTNRMAWLISFLLSTFSL
jgi:hypothetical protein